MRARADHKYTAHVGINNDTPHLKGWLMSPPSR